MAQKIKKSEGTTILIKNLRGMIEQARGHVAHAIDSTLVMLYLRIGQRINQDILKHKRAGYGEEIVSTLSRQLTADFRKGFSRYNLSRMIQFEK